MSTDTTAADLPVPEVGDAYIERVNGQRVTITRVWDLGDGYGMSVAYEWHDDKPGLCGSACPLHVFHRAYRPEAEPDAGLSPVLIAIRDGLAHAFPGNQRGALDAARMLLAAHARELGTLVHDAIQADRERAPGGGSTGPGRNFSRRGGMMSARQMLDRYADDLDAAAAGGDQ